jgi:hypothetical protein
MFSTITLTTHSKLHGIETPGARTMIRGLLVAAAIAAPIAVPIAAASIQAPRPSVISADDQCGDGWEWSKTAGTCIPAPTRTSTPPQGATYQCADGTYSYSKSSKGACSDHGGVDHAL